MSGGQVSGGVSVGGASVEGGEYHPTDHMYLIRLPSNIQSDTLLY